MKTTTPRIVALVLASTASLMAQTVAPTPDAKPAENVTVLDAFVVNTDSDNGYIATDSLAGGRTNTPIKLTPSSMSSLTRTFIDDLGITNVRDALKWSPNVIPGDYNVGKQLSNPFNNYDFNFRGAGQSLQGGAGPTRNYFTFYSAADSYNVDRIEFDRGPNSILFGVGTVGGVLSTYTKIPRVDKDFTTITTTIDSNGGARFEFDVNRRLTDKLAVRVNALVDRNKGWRNNDKNESNALDLAVLYKPTDSTTVRVELEGSKSKNTLISSAYEDRVSRWDGVTSAANWGDAPSGTQQLYGWSDHFNLLIPGLESKGAMNWNGGAISYGIDPGGIQVAPYAGWYSTFQPLYSWMAAPPAANKIPVLPSRKFTFGNGISRPEYADGTVFLDHKFNKNLDFEVSAYRYDSTQTAQNYEAGDSGMIDLSKQLPDGTTNPNFGKMFSSFFLSKQQQDRTVSEIRAQLNYKLEGKPFGIPVKQLFSAAAGSQRITWTARQYMAQIQDPALTAPEQRMVWGRLYFDNPNATIKLPATLNGFPVAYSGWPTDWFDFDETYTLKNIAAVSHTRLWDDKLSVLAGIRHDQYTHHKVGVNNPAVVEDSAGGTTYSAGGIYYFKWLGLFANYSKNFDPIGPGKQNALSGKPFGPSSGKGFEYGLRISTDDSKYYASLSRYDSKSQNRIFNGGKPDFAGMWRNYYDSLGQARDLSRSTINYDDTEALKVSGYEVDIVANPTKNIRLSFTYGKPDSVIADALPDSRAYYAANLATWQTATTAAPGGSTPAASDLMGQITSVKGQLDQNLAGKTKTGLVDYTLSFFANYTFTNEALKGFSAGGGFTYTGKQYVGDFGAPDGQTKFAHYADKRVSTSLVFAYETKLGKIPTRFALNIDNVFDDKDPIVTGYHWGWVTSPGKAVASSYDLPPPRTFRLSMRLSL